MFLNFINEKFVSVGPWPKLGVEKSGVEIICNHSTTSTYQVDLHGKYFEPIDKKK